MEKIDSLDRQILEIISQNARILIIIEGGRMIEVGTINALKLQLQLGTVLFISFFYQLFQCFEKLLKQPHNVISLQHVNCPLRFYGLVLLILYLSGLRPCRLFPV